MIDNDYEECKKILVKEYSPERIPAIDLLDWIKRGIDFHKDKSNCLFCGSPISNLNDIESKYISYISNEKQKDLKFVSEYHKKLSQFYEELLSFIKKLDDYQENGIDVIKEKDELGAYLDTIEKFIETLNKKIDRFEEKIYFSNDLVSLNNNISNVLNKINHKKESAYNSIVKEEAKINDLIKGRIGKNVINNKNIQKNMKDYKESIAEYKKVEDENNKINLKIKQLKNSISIIGDFASYINEILLNLDIKFKLDIIDNDYRILPLNDTQEISTKDISEGETNLLAFLFFYFELFAQLDNNFIKDEIKYIIIDDPVSSLDENNRTYLETLIKNLLSISSCQVFVLTHDWTSFCNLLYKYNPKDLRNDTSNIRAFELKKNKDCNSFLSLANPTITPYEHDFFEVLEVFENKKADDLVDYEIYHLPNCLRRVLESFLSFKTSKSSPTDKNFLNIKNVFYPTGNCSLTQENKLHSALTIINANSHKPARNATEVYTAVKFLVGAIKQTDSTHFNMIKGKMANYNKINNS